MYNSINNEVGKDFSLVLAGNKFDIVNQEEVRDRYGKSLGAHFTLLSGKVTKIGLIIILKN